MGCNTNTYNLGIRNILLGKDRPQLTCIFAKADVAGSLAGKYFVIHEPVTQVKHVFWMDDGVATSPLIPNATHHPISYTHGDDKNTIAAAINGVIGPLAWINSTNTMGNEVECTMVTNGYAYQARDGLDPVKKSGFTVKVAQFGSVQLDLGATNGNIKFKLEEKTKEITAPQTGDFLLAEIRRGAQVTSSFELKDTSSGSIRRALQFYGSTIVTDDSASEVLSGYGSSNLFTSTDDVADQLILRPTDKAADGDSSEDFTIHKSKLKLGETTFSADNELVLPIDVMGYLDTSKSAFVNLFAYGNGASVPSST